MKLKQILKTLEKDYGWSFYDENKVLHLEEMQQRLILDVAEVAKKYCTKPVVKKSLPKPKIVCLDCGCKLPSNYITPYCYGCR